MHTINKDEIAAVEGVLSYWPQHAPFKGGHRVPYMITRSMDGSLIGRSASPSVGKREGNTTGMGHIQSERVSRATRFRRTC
jgi:hypothetical protein